MADMEMRVVKLLQEDADWVKKEREGAKTFLQYANERFAASVSFAERLTGKKVIVEDWKVTLG